jgi:hypothetical protein
MVFTSRAAWHFLPFVVIAKEFRICSVQAMKIIPQVADKPMLGTRQLQEIQVAFLNHRLQRRNKRNRITNHQRTE